MTPASFVQEAHRHGHHGPAALKTYAMRLNAQRPTPGVLIVDTPTLEQAVRLEEYMDEAEREPADG